jgi:hypothetical protein
MTALNGWSHDRYGSTGMLLIEALAGVLCVVFALVAVARLRGDGSEIR